MVENLKETVKNILEDEKEVKEFGELKTLEEVYERCKELGYKSDYEEFKKDYNQIVYGLSQEISSEELKSVTGGKMNKKLTKTMATALSALTLSTAVVPCTSAANLECQTSQNKILRYIKENPGKSLLIALGATATVGSGVLVIGGIKHFFGKNEQNTIEDEVVTPKTNSQQTTPSPEEDYNKACEESVLDARRTVGRINLERYVENLGEYGGHSYPKNNSEVYKCLYEMFNIAVDEGVYDRPSFYDNSIKLIHKMYSQGNVGMGLISNSLAAFAKKVKTGGYENVVNFSYNLKEVIEHIMNKSNLTREEKRDLFFKVFDFRVDGEGEKIFKNADFKYYDDITEENGFKSIVARIDSKFFKGEEYTIKRGYFPIIRSADEEGSCIIDSQKLSKINLGNDNENSFYVYMTDGTFLRIGEKGGPRILAGDKNYLKFFLNGKINHSLIRLEFPNEGNWHNFENENTRWHVNKDLGVVMVTDLKTKSFLKVYSIKRATEEIQKGDKSEIDINATGNENKNIKISDFLKTSNSQN